MVHLRIRDIYLPDPQEVAISMCGDLLVPGRVVDVSDRGSEEPLAVVSIEGLDRPVVIAVRHLVELP